ncbi:ABC transporter permease [Anaerobacillus sp. MEB173]|uniref:ABC transporter permease n=1 Tax=Anaerobacillus sp. MEB173 TaxID=3383345 RepID=UPI003F8F3261
MSEVIKIWNKRAKDYWNEAIRYLRLIGNSGFLFTIYLAIIFGSYYYSVFLKWLPETFPTPYILAVITAFIVTRSRIRTFVKEADLVFLTPIEGKLTAYFRRSIIYSFLFQSFFIILVMIVLAPLYSQRIASEGNALLLTILILLIANLWNLLCRWEEQRLQSEGSRAAHMVLRFFINVTLTFFLFAQAPFYFLLAIGLLMLLLTLFYYRHLSQKHSIKWENLLVMEEKMLTTFYRVANSFTDVPKLKARVKQRRIVSSITNLFPFKRQFTYQYIYSKTFIRSDDYFGIYMRLLIIGGILLFVIPEGYSRLFVFVLVVYMSGLQLSTLWNHHDTKIWLDLYPIPVQERKAAFSQIVFILLFLKSFVFLVLLIFTGEVLIQAFLFAGIGFVISYVYAYKLVHRRKKNMNF